MISCLVVTHLISVKFVAMPWIEMFTKTEDIVRFNLLPRLLQLMACYFIINMLLDKVNEYFQQYDRVIGENHGSLEKKDSEFDEFIEILDQLTESEKKSFWNCCMEKQTVRLRKNYPFPAELLKTMYHVSMTR